MQQRSGLGTERDADLMRETLLETSPWLLGLTFVVSLLHTLFDFLAFKNDIQFWQKKKSMTGMSVRTLAVNCFFQTVRSSRCSIVVGVLVLLSLLLLWLWLWLLLLFICYPSINLALTHTPHSTTVVVVVVMLSWL